MMQRCSSLVVYNMGHTYIPRLEHISSPIKLIESTCILRVKIYFNDQSPEIVKIYTWA